MKDLKAIIAEAKTTDELENIVKNIPLQENGFPQKIARILENTFWYADLETFESKQSFMLSRLK